MKTLDRTNNFLYLFLVLLLFLFFASVVAEFTNFFSTGAFNLLIVTMLVVSIRTLHTDTNWRRIVFVLLPVFVVFNILEHLFNSKVYIFLVLSSLLIFFIGFIAKAFKQVLFEGVIDANKIIGSITLYILFGLAWTVIYLIILVYDPHAFSGVEASGWQTGFARMAYYSFVTLTTLGYGDILPKNHIAEFFVYFEAITGVFYMAIIVSSLINLRLHRMENEK